ncbi:MULTISPECIES: hydantoinase B/oxoprolinase family protein [Amycolatopsis]|uniref:hydantoinase B/oxoprolinase family protein n=1 Tax=Amycolatopsis TaxID=1813 RepID=UPI000B8AD106|nr:MULTISPECIES: hydantoinase B/oxoprolinase family protein [Amycolatopsis]OXM67139.1 methylhydantoinase [Amycolatopsis sp. KNN50.9b]
MTSKASLRDLDDAEFRARYDSDRFTTTLLGNRMRYIVEHMSAGILTNTFSLILRDWYDFNATISGPPEQNYPMPAVGNSLAAFFGTMSEAVRNTVEEYGPDELAPGDVLIANDPYRVGNHVNDMCFIRPVFVEGRIVSFVTIRAHQLDMGGIVPAGFSSTKHNVYETGLSLPPLLLYRDDRPVKSTFNLILDNSRFGPIIVPDMRTIHQSLRLGERLIQESIERYGLDAYLGAIRYAVDASAESMAAAIRELPDGVYSAEEFVDADGVDDSVEYRVRVSLTKVDDRLEIDFSGSSPQARTCINASVLDTKSAVVMALKFLIDPASPYTSGAFRSVDMVLPAGTLLSATPPDGAVFMYWEATQPVICAIFRALEPALGERAVGGDYGSLGIHNANGVLPNGTPWVGTAQCGAEHGPWGATRHGDADSYQVFYQANSLDPATEAIESDIPAVVLRKEYVIDSAGVGTHRGGAAVRKDTLYLADAEHWTSPLSTKRAAGIGVHGGGDGGRSAAWLFPPGATDVAKRGDLVGTDDSVYSSTTPVAGVLDPQTKTLDAGGEYFYFASNPVWRTDPGAMFRYQTNGGGGWGDPLERDPQRVLVDVRDEYFSVGYAAEKFGVVVLGDPHADPEGLRVDEAATESRRGELRAAR